MHSNFAALQQLASCADDYPDLHLDKHILLCNDNGTGIGPKKAEWHSTIRALQNLLGPEQASEVVRTLAGILYLTTLPTDRSRAAEDGTLEITVSCLGLSTEVVQSYFYERKIGNDKMLAYPAQVQTSRDNLICHLNSKIFQVSWNDKCVPLRSLGD
ncbi:hypothetical protein BCR39DRAFT_52281 [Naematelia encephala]|uniref:Uncharacterized protein n=1 Tax=Naematelia encephala TaxID=71784 RepID=A0A1Y2AGW3_9TREE|nr:hypothetical protein BCR39DRAFT_52281 [Naematelia encephala]